MQIQCSGRARLVPLLVLLAMALVACVNRFVFTEIALESSSSSSSLSSSSTSTHVTALDRLIGSPSSPATRDSSTDGRATAAPPIQVIQSASTASERADVDEYDCVGFRRTGGCSPDGAREPPRDLSCGATIPRGASGYCEFHHKTDHNASTLTGRRVLGLHCNSLRPPVRIQCSQAHDYLTFGDRSLQYLHDHNFTFAQSQHDLLQLHDNRNRSRTKITNTTQQLNGTELFTKGIAIVVFDDVMVSAYASIRSLRALGCSLPIEIWYKTNETRADHPLLVELVANHGAFRREIRDPRATTFYTKLYAVFYSAFDQVLLLDADNFAVKDPLYLFETPEFKEKGAMFWPDFWRPNQTIFHVHAHNLVWQVFDLPFVDMFEQESGQVLIDRRRHQKALNTMMFYGFGTIPRVHEQLRLVWGDKDLFRLAWLKTNSSFHFITRPPGVAGLRNAKTKKFCGLSMVQHDPHGEILFLHRNTMKILEDPTSHWPQWRFIQQLKRTAPLSKYDIVRTTKLINKNIDTCWGRPDHYTKSYSMRKIDAFAFRELESHVLAFASEALVVLQDSR